MREAHSQSLPPIIVNTRLRWKTRRMASRRLQSARAFFPSPWHQMTFLATPVKRCSERRWIFSVLWEPQEATAKHRAVTRRDIYLNPPQPQPSAQAFPDGQRQAPARMQSSALFWPRVVSKTTSFLGPAARALQPHLRRLSFVHIEFPTTSHARQCRNDFSQSPWKSSEKPSLRKTKEVSSTPALSEFESLQVWGRILCLEQRVKRSMVQSDGLLSFSLPAPTSPSA